MNKFEQLSVFTLCAIKSQIEELRLRQEGLEAQDSLMWGYCQCVIESMEVLQSQVSAEIENLNGFIPTDSTD